MTINMKDVSNNVVEIRDENFANMMQQLYEEIEFDSPDIESFIEWVRYGCSHYNDET